MIQKIFSLLTPKERMSAYTCFIAMLIMAFFEVIGVAAIMPFMAVLSDPEAIQHHAKLAWIYNYFNFTNNHQFLILLGFMVLGVLVISNIISMLTIWLMMRFTYARQYSLSMQIFRRYLYQPYTFFIERNPSELARNILNEVLVVVTRAFIPGMQLIAKGIVTLLILLLLLIIDPVLAFVLAFMMGGAYFAIYFKVRSKLSAISKQCLEASKQKFKIVNETFGGIKDIKLLGREKYFLETFSKYAKQHADNESVGNCIAALPRYALETIAFGGVLVIILYLLVMQKNIENALPLLALYAFASLRLMPAMQQIFTSMAFLRMSRDALNVLTKDLHELDYHKNDSILKKPLQFQSTLNMREIQFSYANKEKPILESFNLTIPVNSTVGIVGMTGAGKSTVVDLILGLLVPQKGQILIDQMPVSHETLPHWQSKIGYVPQMIFLADDTITNNIAFGIPADEIDIFAVKRAARMANIHDFVTKNLEKGFETVIGDRGIRLSGGQRQRIGIARALYHDPDVLVLDEATSSLDTLTEDVILEAIQGLARKKNYYYYSPPINDFN